MLEKSACDYMLHCSPGIRATKTYSSLARGLGVSLGISGGIGRLGGRFCSGGSTWCWGGG